MANIILLEDMTDSSKLWEFPLIEDIQIEYKSEYENMMDGIPLIGDILSMMERLAGLSATDAEVSTETVRFKTMMSMERWKMTQPIRFNAKLAFYTKTNSFKDVVTPMKDLISYSILSLTEDKKNYKTPGVSVSAINKLKDAAEGKGKDDIFKNGKLLIIDIPGIVRVIPAMIEQATPTYSKQLTESGYPLWGTLELQIKGFYPASTEIMENIGKALVKVEEASVFA